MAQTQHDAVLRERALAGLRRYQHAQRAQRPPAARVIARHRQARLLQYGATLPADRAPVIVVPSLINPPHVLDLSDRTSLMRWMAAQGHGALLVDWGQPAPQDAGLDLAGHVAERLLPLIAQIDHPRAPVLVGYCLGGTLALAAACVHPVQAVATIATPWHFAAMPQQNRDDIARLWAQAKPMCARLGYVPMEVLQSGFWMLDPAQTIAKYADFGALAEGSEGMAAFMALEDWANDGPPLTYAAGCDLFERLYGQDATGAAAWQVAGCSIDIATLAIPTLSISSSTDRIVPAATAAQLDENWMLDLGHVGMIVGSRGREQLWQPLSRWLANQGG